VTLSLSYPKQPGSRRAAGGAEDKFGGKDPKPAAPDPLPCMCSTS